MMSSWLYKHLQIKKAVSLLNILALALPMVLTGVTAPSFRGEVRPAAAAAAYGESRITTDPGDQSLPDISGDNIVFTDWRHGNPEIYLHNLTTGLESNVTTDSELQYNAAISGDRIVWEDRRAGNWDVFMLETTVGLPLPLTLDPQFQGYPDISGDKIVWRDWRNGNDDIYLYDTSAALETQITTDPASQEGTAVNGNIIVWQDWRNDPGDSSNADIYMHDLNTGIESPVTTEPANQKNPAVWGDKVVWEDFRNGNADIYMRNLTTGVESKITTNTAAQMGPAIYDDKVVWSDGRNGAEDIYLYSLTTGVESRITTSPASQVNPSISGDKIVYSDNRNTFGDIYMFTLDTQSPTGAMAVNGGAANTGSADVVINSSANDAGSGVAQMSFSNDGLAWSAWEPFAAVKNWNLGPGGGNKTVWARFRDAMGNESPAYFDTIFIDTVSPTASMAAPKLSTNVSKTKIFTVSWTGVDAGGSGIASYDVQVKKNSTGAWTAWKANTTLKTAIYTGAPGNTYYFRARAKDRAGNTGPYSAEAKTIVPLDQSKGIVKRVGFAGTISKASSNYYLGTVRYSTTRGDVITYSFTGNYFALIGTKGPKYSKAVVIIDGVKKTIDARAGSKKLRQVLMEKSLTMKKHTVKIKNLGTAGRKRFEIDGNAVGK